MNRNSSIARAFLADLTHGDGGSWFSHRALLWLALETTAKDPAPVLELGMGAGSTPYLHEYCAAMGRRLVSYENNAAFAAGFSPFVSDTHEIRVVDWEMSGIDFCEWSVALVDHAPPERRAADVRLLADRCGVIVIHDSEARSTGYGLDDVWCLFRYRADINMDGVGTSVVSNRVDLTALDGEVFDGRRVIAKCAK